MKPKTRPPASEPLSKESPFRHQLIQTLENFTDPEWLGNNSALAAPYFLGDALLHSQDKANERIRGIALQELLRGTAKSLVDGTYDGSIPEDGDYLYRLLELSFFRPLPLPQLLNELGISKSTYYRPGHRLRAIQTLETALIRQVKPALRAEVPPTTPISFVERPAPHSDCLSALQKQQNVMLLGASGVGKTTLAAQIATAWSASTDVPYFWYTFRPGLNDRVASLLFSMGQFLHSMGASLLWMQLMAGGESQELEMLVGLLRRDLESLENARPLLCLDDLDRIDPAEHESHAQIVGLLNSLHAMGPLLLVGQKPLLEPDRLVSLGGFSLDEAKALLTLRGVDLIELELEQFFAFTNGNARLIELFVSLHKSGESVKDVLARLSQAPSVEFLLERLWQRLGEDEITLLIELSVFRRPAPSDAFVQKKAFPILEDMHLIRVDEHGRISLVAAFQGVIYRRLTPEEKAYLHLCAGRIRAERGEVTAAAYHYIKAGRADYAVWLWYNQRKEEIDQGQGFEALSIFSEISSEQLEEPERELLVLLRGELGILAGDYESVKRDLYAKSWERPLLRIRAHRMEGDLAIELSHFDDAIRAFREGLEDLDSLQIEMTQLHTRHSEANRRKRDLPQAWIESQRARYEVEHLQGDIQSNLGKYDEAQALFENALAIAQQIGYLEGEGRTRNNLGLLLSRMGNGEAAERHWSMASLCYQKIGRRTWQAGIKLNQAAFQVQKGDPSSATKLIEDALVVYEDLNHARGRALANFQLAEAYLKLGQLEQARTYAWASLNDNQASIKAATFGVLADISYEDRQLDEAQTFCRKSISLAEETSDYYSCAFAWRTLGQVHEQHLNYPEARQAYEKASQIFQKLDIPEEQEVVDSFIGQLPALQGQ